MEKLQPSIRRRQPEFDPANKTGFSQFRKSACRYCDTQLGEAFLDLGLSPLANALPMAAERDKEEFVCPLRLVKCSACHLIQLSHVVPPEMMFSNYLYVSSTTKTFRDHFAEYACSVKNRLVDKDGALAVDIGSNDGLLLSCYRNEGLRAIGVEPARNLCREANRKGLMTINRFFDSEAVHEIVKNHGQAHIVSGNNVFAHIDDIQSVLRDVTELLNDRGIFVIEFPYLITMVKELLFDTIYHEHLSYISVFSLQFVLNRFGLKIFAIDRVSSHGGSLRVFIEKDQAGLYPVGAEVRQFLKSENAEGYCTSGVYEEFATNVEKAKKTITSWMTKVKGKGQSVAGYGAPAKATTLINYCGLSDQEVDFVVDDNPLKQNRLIPGAKIPIISSGYFFKHPTDYVIIFAWNFADEILAKLKRRTNDGTRFVIPLPTMKII